MIPAGIHIYDIHAEKCWQILATSSIIFSAFSHISFSIYFHHPYSVRLDQSILLAYIQDKREGSCEEQYPHESTLGFSHDNMDTKAIDLVSP